MFQGFGTFFSGNREKAEENSASTTPAAKAQNWSRIRRRRCTRLGAIGLLKRLEAAGIVPDIVAGHPPLCSCGRLLCGGQNSLARRICAPLTKRRILSLLDITFRGAGLIGGNKLASLLDHDLIRERIEELPKKFCAVATELRTGHEIWLQRGALVEACALLMPARNFPACECGRPVG